MNRIVNTFKKLKKTGRRACIPYMTAGDPDLDKTLELLVFYAENGADIIELGVPFSDPMADGPVIQEVMEKAVEGGTTLKDIFGIVKRFRSRYNTPIILMGYYNPFWAYGIGKFAGDARDAGVDGILTVDLPPEEADDFVSFLKGTGLVSIFLATPVTDEKRIRTIRKFARGFVYFVSVTGVTGERFELPHDITERIGAIHDRTGLPVVIGFGISGPEFIGEFYSYADGFVIGSALVKRWGEAQRSDEKKQEFKAFFEKLAYVCHNHNRT